MSPAPRRKGVRHLLPERPEGCFAQKVPDPFSPWGPRTPDQGFSTMLQLTLNGERRTLPEVLTVAQLLEQLGYDRRRVAVEVNQEVVPLPRHGERVLANDDH